ncbi:dolichyl-diphosphooligosaccharide--protein glycosyltransferase [Cystoisospora suis]|uniref:Dolichyl-diphosphooligosaccharide--protein glycosyltransferase n=1 Tax=Cystoisospora suis TaxID=483139 RepID=A0A2C6KLK0_9APIC|nr:dolichyl-diphosphooligosaccharide--protein glycosyltransferase [Cystoisospora suis]
MSSRPKSLSSVEEDEQHFVLLRAPSTAFRSSKEDTSRRTSSPMLWGREDAHEEEEEEDRREKSDRSGNDFVGGTDLALATAFQASHNGRGIVLASTEFCSDDVMRLGAEVSSDDFLVNDGAPEDGNEHKNLKIANLRVCEDLLLWALNRRGVLRYSNLKHFKPGESVSPHLYRMQDTITFSIDLHQLSEGAYSSVLFTREHSVRLGHGNCFKGRLSFSSPRVFSSFLF